MGYLFLAGAILSEVIGTIFLRFTSGERTYWWAYPIVVVGYIASFWLLSLTLSRGIPLAIAYAIWGGVGVVLVAIASWVLFKETLTPVQIGGILVVVIGIGMLEPGASHPAESS